jgi:hypothetical protein
MNNESSRSHAVFTLKLTQTLSTEATEVKFLKFSIELLIYSFYP